MSKELSVSFKSGVIAAFIGLVISFLLNYFFIPMPETAISNATGHGVTGLISGFMGGFMGLFVFLKATKTAEEK